MLSNTLIANAVSKRLPWQRSKSTTLKTGPEERAMTVTKHAFFDQDDSTTSRQGQYLYQRTRRRSQHCNTTQLPILAQTKLRSSRHTRSSVVLHSTSAMALSRRSACLENRCQLGLRNIPCSYGRLVHPRFQWHL